MHVHREDVDEKTFLVETQSQRSNVILEYMYVHFQSFMILLLLAFQW